MEVWAGTEEEKNWFEGVKEAAVWGKVDPPNDPSEELVGALVPNPPKEGVVLEDALGPNPKPVD